MSWYYSSGLGLYLANQNQSTSNFFLGPGNTITYDANYGTDFNSVEGGATVVNNVITSFYNGAGYNFLTNVYGFCNNIFNNVYASNITASNMNVDNLSVSNLSIVGEYNAYKQVTYPIYGTPYFTSGDDTYILTLGQYGSEVNLFGGQFLPIGVAGFNNDSNTSNCYVKLEGSLNINPTNSNFTPVTSTFQFWFATDTVGVNNLTHAQTASGNDAKLNITSYNGLVGGIGYGVSDTFLFPNQFLGNSNARVFLFMNVTDTTTVNDGFYVGGQSSISFF